ncbi:MAG: hypothetical protein SNJ64_02820 [Endomicrobiia bacterium]
MVIIMRWGVELVKSKRIKKTKNNCFYDGKFFINKVVVKIL